MPLDSLMEFIDYKTGKTRGVVRAQRAFDHTVQCVAVTKITAGRCSPIGAYDRGATVIISKRQLYPMTPFPHDELVELEGEL